MTFFSDETAGLKARMRTLNDHQKNPLALSAYEARFLAEKRDLGWSDTQIAKMLGCSIERIRRNIVAADPLPSRIPGPRTGQRTAYIDPHERSLREAEALSGRVWRPKSK
jgi:hypothetical protein